MKITKRHLRRIIKEEAHDCYKDYKAGGLSYEEYQDCLKRFAQDDYGYSSSRRKTSYVGADANQDKIAAVQAALAIKPNNFLQSILSQLERGRGLSSKQKSIVKKILAKVDPEASALFEGKMKITEQKLRKTIREAFLKEAMQSWEERKAEMDAWEKKLADALPKDPSKMSNADHKKVAQVFIDEFGLDQADAFYEDDRGTLADLGVKPYPDLENIRMAIVMAQDKEHQKVVSSSPDKKELMAIGGDQYGAVAPREVEYLTYQPIRRGGKVVAFMVEDEETEWGTMPLGHSSFVVDEQWAKQFGTTVDKIIKVLEKGGATLRKKRKPIKHTPPMYD